jgi:hypothetical protein
MSAATHNNYAPGFPPSSARVEPPADCADARAGGHLAPGACAPAAPGVLSGKRRSDPTPYSQADIDTIHRMRREGATWQQVADAIGRNKKAVEMSARRLGAIGIGAAAWTQEQVDALRALADARTPHKQIADTLKRSIRAVRAKLAELYVKPKRKHRKAEPLPAPPVPREKPVRVAPAITKPKADRTQEAMRRCLCGCGKMFWSHGPGNRIRPECMGLYDYRHTGAV